MKDVLLKDDVFDSEMICRYQMLITQLQSKIVLFLLYENIKATYLHCKKVQVRCFSVNVNFLLEKPDATVTMTTMES